MKPYHHLAINTCGQAIRLTVVALALCSLAPNLPAQGTNLDFQATQAAADKGDAKAQFEVARDYSKGIGVNKDRVKAAKYARQAADQGNADAEILLGSFYGRGMGVPRNMTNAIAWYRKAADQGSALAQYAMGNFYATGRGVTRDMDQAIQWYQKACAQHQAEAEDALGKIYLVPTDGYGNKYLNYPEARRLLQLAVADGSVPAMNDLGVLYDNGYGVPANAQEAVKWYQQAADYGDAKAQGNLGQLYFDGRGVPLDLVQAYKWLKLGTRQGNPMASVIFENYNTHQLLTPAQLAQAEELFQDFRVKPVPGQEATGKQAADKQTANHL